MLEVGCGTGAILSDLQTDAAIFALDIDTSRLAFSSKHVDSQALLLGGDGQLLPFTSGAFDIVFCHFLLLWVANPDKVVSEMMRVTRTGGAVIAFAEPDYGSRIDYPDALIELGELQIESLRSQGADPNMGRKVPTIFEESGMNNIQSGVLQGHAPHAPSDMDLELEWEVLRNDLEGKIDPDRMEQLRQLDINSWKSGKRVLFVPTFFTSAIAG